MGTVADAVTGPNNFVSGTGFVNAKYVRLDLGAALLKAGRPKEAEAVYRQELHYLYENGWALFGLWQSLRDQGHAEEAQEIQERFKRAWKNADVVLSASVF